MGCLRDTLVRFLSVWSVPVPGGFQERPYLKTILVWKVSHLILSFVICAPPPTPPHIPNTHPYLPPFLPRSLLHNHTQNPLTGSALICVMCLCHELCAIPNSFSHIRTRTFTHIHTHVSYLGLSSYNRFRLSFTSRLANYCRIVISK